MNKTVSFLLCIFLAAGCAASPGKSSRNFSDPSKNLNHSSEEVRIGEQINAEILSNFHAYTEPLLLEYVTGVGDSLTKDAGRKLPYKFTVLYSDKIYATSAPGGFVYLTTGMLYFLNNESELAAVIAHEIGELQFQDPKLSKSRKLLEAVTKGGSAVGPAFGEIGMLAVLGLAAVSAVAQSREYTPEEKIAAADKKALQYMVSAGYDPQGMIDLLYKFLNANPEAMPYFYDYYQARPIDEKRFQSLTSEFEKLPINGKTFDTRPQAYQEHTKGIREIYER